MTTLYFFSPDGPGFVLVLCTRGSYTDSSKALLHHCLGGLLSASLPHLEGWLGKDMILYRLVLYLLFLFLLIRLLVLFRRPVQQFRIFIYDFINVHKGFPEYYLLVQFMCYILLLDLRLTGL